MCNPILLTLLKMWPHYSQSSHENVTPSSSTSLLPLYKEVPPSPLGPDHAVPSCEALLVGGWGGATNVTTLNFKSLLCYGESHVSISILPLYLHLFKCCIFHRSLCCTVKKTFTTLCSYQPDRGSSGHIYEIKEDQESSIRLHFIKFETKYIEMCVNFIKDNILTAANKDKALKATGNQKPNGEFVKKFHEKEALTKNEKCPNASNRQHTYSLHDKHPCWMFLKLPSQYLTMPFRKYHQDSIP